MAVVGGAHPFAVLDMFRFLSVPADGGMMVTRAWVFDPAVVPLSRNSTHLVHKRAHSTTTVTCTNCIVATNALCAFLNSPAGLDSSEDQAEIRSTVLIAMNSCSFVTFVYTCTHKALGVCIVDTTAEQTSLCLNVYISRAEISKLNSHRCRNPEERWKSANRRSLWP